MFHLRVDEVEPNVFVTVTVSVEVAPNSTYTADKYAIIVVSK